MGEGVASRSLTLLQFFLTGEVVFSTELGSCPGHVLSKFQVTAYFLTLPSPP